MIHRNFASRDKGHQAHRMNILHWLAMLVLAFTMAGCGSSGESDPGGTGTVPPPGGTPPPPPPPPPPPASDQAIFEATLHPLLKDAANNCVTCHGVAQSPTFSVDDVTTAYNEITVQQKVDLTNPALSRVYLRPADDRHNCGGETECDRIAADFLTAIQDWATQAAAIAPPPDPITPVVSGSATFADAIDNGGDLIMSFDIESVVGAPATIEMQVAELDASGYLFAKPTFVSDETAVAVKNIRIVVNGTTPVAAQAFRNVDAVAMATGEELSPLGSIIPVALGVDMDVFHLEFEVLGDQTGLGDPVFPASPPAALPDVVEADIGVRSFSQVRDTMSTLTGIAAGNAAVSTDYVELRDSLPPTTNILAFGSAQQIAIHRLARTFCGEIALDTVACDDFFGNNCEVDGAAKGLVADVLYDSFIGVNVANQPARADVTTEVISVLDDLACVNGCVGAEAQTALQSTCTAVLSSAAVTVN